MIPGLNPKKMQAVMKQLGIKQEDIDATRVIIEKNDGNIVIENPQVTKVNMQGQETFQISGDIRESEEETSNKEEFEKDIKTIMEKTNVDKEKAALALEENTGDIAATILDLNK